jgi:hypothetical protein
MFGEHHITGGASTVGFLTPVPLAHFFFFLFFGSSLLSLGL